MKIQYCCLLLLPFLALPALAQPSNPRMSASAPAPANTNAPPPDKTKLNQMVAAHFAQELERSPDLISLLDYDVIVKAMQEDLSGKPALPDAELREVSRQLGEYLRGRQELKSIEAKKEGEEFLAKNAKADGVKTLPDGLQYKIIKEGSGDHPKSNDIVHVKYKGTLIDGTEFDHNDNAKLSLLGVVQGWKEALPMMAPGAEWQLVIPSDLGYGPRGMRKIPANAVLIFDIELLSFEAPPVPPALPASKPTTGTSGGTNQVVSGEIIKVPSAEGLKRGEKIEVIKPGETNVVESGTPK